MKYPWHATQRDLRAPLMIVDDEITVERSGAARRSLSLSLSLCPAATGRAKGGEACDSDPDVSKPIRIMHAAR